MVPRGSKYPIFEDSGPKYHSVQGTLKYSVIGSSRICLHPRSRIAGACSRLTPGRTLQTRRRHMRRDDTHKNCSSVTRYAMCR